MKRIIIIAIAILTLTVCNNEKRTKIHEISYDELIACLKNNEYFLTYPWIIKDIRLFHSRYPETKFYLINSSYKLKDVNKVLQGITKNFIYIDSIFAGIEIYFEVSYRFLDDSNIYNLSIFEDKEYNFKNEYEEKFYFDYMRKGKDKYYILYSITISEIIKLNRRIMQSDPGFSESSKREIKVIEKARKMYIEKFSK